MEQNKKKLSKCIIGLQPQKEISDFVKVVGEIELEPKPCFNDNLREKLLADRLKFSDPQALHIHLGGRNAYVDHEKATERYIS